MPLTFGELRRLIRTPWNERFDDVSIELQVWAVERAVRDLVSCWRAGRGESGGYTFDRLPPEVIPPHADVDRLVREYDATRPAFAVAFRRSTLHDRWPEAYERPGSDLVAIDGNTRLTALARRLALGHDDGHVGVFVERV